MGRSCQYIKFSYPPGLAEIPNLSENREVAATIKFFGEEPRKMSLTDWYGEIHANLDDTRYPELWSLIENELERDFKRKNFPTNQASKLIQMVLELPILLFHDERGKPHARIPLQKGGYRIISLDEQGFAEYLANQYYMAEGTAPGTQPLGDCLRTLRAKAVYEGGERTLFLRIGEQGGAFYYDMADDRGRSVKITPDGWEICEPPVIFRRFGHMLPQEEPLKKGTELLGRFVSMWHLANSDNEDLVKIVLCCYLVPGIPKVVLGLHGPPGSAKSLFTKAIKMLFDPSSIVNQRLPIIEDELLRALSRNYISTFDNVRNMKSWQSDDICIATTGGTTVKRALYSNDDDFSRNLRAATILNGVNMEINEPDLLDRSITIELNALPSEVRRSEREVMKEIEELIPGLLAELFDHLSRAMKVHASIEVKEKPRMADWYEWALSFAEVLGVGQDRFKKIYADLQEKQNGYAIDNNLVGTVLSSYLASELGMDQPYIAGTPTEWMNHLTQHAEEVGMNTKGVEWPKTVPEFGKELKKVQKNLEQNGIFIVDCKYRHIRDLKAKLFGIFYKDSDRIKIVSRNPALSEKVGNKGQTKPVPNVKLSQWADEGIRTGGTGEVG